MKTTLAILGIISVAALVAGTVAVTESYAYLWFRNIYGTVHNSGSQTNQATINQGITQNAANTCSGSGSC